MISSVMVNKDMITKHELSVILIRILALHILLQAVSIFPMSFRVFPATPVSFVFSYEFTAFAVSVIVWFLARPLSVFIVKDIKDNSNTNTYPSYIQFEIIIFSIVGLIVLATAIPELANMLAYNSIIDTIQDDASLKLQATASSRGFTAKYITKIVVGCGLLFFSDKLCFFIQKIRTKI